ncbi:MAG: aldehyde ferredoxin oxidoreductase family protein [Anaerolineae bacterium]
MNGGYMGKLLRVDLTEGTVTEEALPGEAILRKCVGCLGLAMKMLNDEVPPEVGPVDPENRLIFMTGPLTGTPAPSSSNFVVASINYDVPYMAGTAHSHGYWGAYLKMAGYDGIVVQGAAKKPVFLWVHDGQAEILPADDIWGKDTHETEDLVKERVGDGQEVSVAAIGPAGENVIHGALIQNDKNHTAAKGGMGAIMGAKKLKAIAVSGRRGVPMADPAKVLEVTEVWRNNIYAAESVGKLLSKGGITRVYGYVGQTSMLAGKNLSDPEWGVKYSSNIVEAAKDWRVTPVGCYGCPIACSYRVEITTGPKKGVVATLGGGGENTEGAAAIIGVLDPGTALWLTDLHDRLGFDSSAAGCSLSLAYELYERGIITKEDTGGLELKWGNAEAAVELLNMIIRREGFGAVLADGPKKAAERIGGEAPKYAVHIKGTGYNLHDWRPVWSVLLGQVIAGAGPCWQAPGVDAWATEPDLGYPEFTPGTTAEGKPEQVKKTQMKKLWEDCLGVCWFATWGVPKAIELAPQALGATVGWEDFTSDEAFQVGERVINLERIFALKRGMTPEHDLDISPRLLEAPPSGQAKGKSIEPYLKDMVKEYYRLMGWDEETGKPSKETLSRLGLEEYAQASGV